MRLRIFIGSSVESLEYARSIQENLEHDDVDCTVWEQGVFGLSQTTIAELLRSLNDYDCAVFVLAPDDKLVLRGQKALVSRDNVLFELGLFCGRLGMGRVFVAAPNDVKDFHVPSDLSGFILAMYRSKRSDGNITAALGTACNKIRRELVKLRAEDVRGVPTIIQRGFFSDFVSTFPSLFLNSKKIILYFIHSRRWREECNDHIH